MGFVTPALIGGALLVAVPIALHLIMRRESKRLVFPALRFVQQRQHVNQHRLKLRHLLLLALRCAIIAFLALALARPTLHGSGTAGKEGAPMAAALVFDNSLRMQYEQDNQTRLDKAKELADWLIHQLPVEVPVTLVDRAGRQRGQDLDHEAAELRVTRLEPTAVVRPMAEALDDAIRWLESKKDYRGEIYVFTDMAVEAWSPETITEFAKALDRTPGASVYLIDVGVAEPKDVGLGALKVSSERLAPGGVLRLDSQLQTLGDAANKAKEATVELFVGDEMNRSEKRGQQVVAMHADRPTPIEFSLAGLKPGPHQGFVRIAGRDALACDDVRYFTVDVRPPTKVLLVAEKPEDAVFLREALSPTAAGELSQSKFQCQVTTFDKLNEAQLGDYAAVCLLDPPPLAPGGWQKLASFAENGGGVGIFLGRHARREEMNAAEAQKLLPGKLRWQSRDTTYVRPVAVEHPALHELGELAATAPWSEFPVFKYWELEAGDDPSPALSPTGKERVAAQVVASFANGKPAVVERQVGAGVVLVMTTSISDAAADEPWNLLPTGSEPWPFIALTNGMVQHLSGGGRAQLNYTAGQTVVLPLGLDEQVSNYVLQMPDGSAVRQSLTPGQRSLSIATAESLGNYRVRAGGQQEKLDRGFSINVPAEMTRLARVSTADSVKALGAERTHVATNRDEISQRVGLGRIGREMFPLLILLVALAMAGEQLLANRFYDARASRMVAAGSGKENEGSDAVGRLRGRSGTLDRESRTDLRVPVASAGERR